MGCSIDQHIGVQGLSAKGRQRRLGRVAAKAPIWCENRAHRPRRPSTDGRSRLNAPEFDGSGRFRAGRPGGWRPARSPSTPRGRRAFRAPGTSFLPAIAFKHLPMGHRFPAAFANRHAVARDLMPVDRPVDRAARPVRRTPDESQVAALERAAVAAMAGELRRQAPCARWSFFATTINPVVSLSSRCTMPGRRSPPMPDRLFAAMSDQRVDQRAGPVSGGRMHHQALGLVDDDHVVVLVDHVERNGFGRRLGRRRLPAPRP